MNSKYISIFLSVYIMCICSSCSDFLKEVSQDEFEPKTASAFQELLNGEGYSTTICLDPITDVLTDDVEGAQGQSDNYIDENLAHRAVYTWQSNMYLLLADYDMTNLLHTYQKLYKCIMACNLVIDGLTDADGTEDEKMQTRGEALALRAYYYFLLVNLYAMPYNCAGTAPESLLGVPLVIKPEIRDEGIARNTVAEVYTQICKDIEEACSLLDGKADNTLGLFRINNVAAHLLASRIYLYMENWDKVLEHADVALADAPALVDLTTYQLSNPAFPHYAINNIISRNFPEVIFINGSMSGSIKTEGTLIRVSESGSNALLRLYDSSDARRNIFFSDMSPLYYKYWMAKRGTQEQGFVWRTAELYLNRAEAYAAKYMAGDNSCGQKAVDDLDALRSKRLSNFVAYTLTTPAALMEFCHEERRRELCFESHRWFDLRRYGMPSIEHTWYDASGNRTVYTLKEKDLGYVLPIPQDAMDTNSALIQNELAPERVGEVN